MAKVAVPVENGRICPHFGHAPQFAFVDVSGEKAVSMEVMVPPPHEPGVLPRWLKDQGATHVVCGGIGAGAVNILRDNGIQLIAGVTGMEPQEAAVSAVNGRLEGVTGPTCDHKHETGGGGCRH